MGSKIYVGGSPYAATEQELSSLFSSHGAVQSARVITDKFTGQSRGFGFVEMSSNEEAQNAIRATQWDRLWRSHVDGERGATSGRSFRRRPWTRWIQRSRHQARSLVTHTKTSKRQSSIDGCRFLLGENTRGHSNRRSIRQRTVLRLRGEW